MRIVYTVLNGRVAGGQVVCLQTMLAARNAGHEVCLISPTEGEFTDMVCSEGIPVFLLPMQRTFQFHQAWKFAQFLKSWRADLVHCHHIVTGTILARLGATAAGVPLISHVHTENAFSGVPWIRALQMALYKVTSRRVAAMIAISQDTRQSLLGQGVPPHKVRVIRNGIRVDNVVAEDATRCARDALGLDAAPPVIGCVARLCEAKGQRDLILAASVVHRVFPEAKFVIIGDDLEYGGQYREGLQELARSLGLSEHLCFAGFQADAARLMHAFDIFVLPSYTEGLPVTILEAMAAAKPVIATRVGGVPEVVIDGETGILVPPKNPELLAEAMIMQLENPEKAQEMGQAGRRRVEAHFSLDHMVGEVLNLYEEVVARRRAVKVPQRG